MLFIKLTNYENNRIVSKNCLWSQQCGIIRNIWVKTSIIGSQLIFIFWNSWWNILNYLFRLKSLANPEIRQGPVIVSGVLYRVLWLSYFLYIQVLYIYKKCAYENNFFGDFTFIECKFTSEYIHHWSQINIWASWTTKILDYTYVYRRTLTSETITRRLDLWRRVAIHHLIAFYDA